LIGGGLWFLNPHKTTQRRLEERHLCHQEAEPLADDGQGSSDDPLILQAPVRRRKPRTADKSPSATLGVAYDIESVPKSMESNHRDPNPLDGPPESNDNDLSFVSMSFPIPMDGYNSVAREVSQMPPPPSNKADESSSDTFGESSSNNEGEPLTVDLIDASPA